MDNKQFLFALYSQRRKLQNIKQQRISCVDFQPLYWYLQNKRENGAMA